MAARAQPCRFKNINMNAAPDPTVDIQDLDSWLASVATTLAPTTQSTEAATALPAWLQEALDGAELGPTAGPSSAGPSTVADGSTSETSGPSKSLERIRRKNRLAQQRSRQRRSEHVKELEDQVRQLRQLLELERQRNAASESNQLTASQRRMPASHATNKEVRGSVSMSRLLAMLADGTLDDRFFPLLGRHFDNSSFHRRSDGSLRSALTDPDSAISWQVSFNTDSSNFARAASTQLGLPSAIVMPELVLYKVCRFYFRLLLPFSTSFGSGMVNLATAELMQEPESVSARWNRHPSDASHSLDDTGTLPELLMPTRLQSTVGSHPIEIAIIPFASLRDRLLLTVLAMNGTQSFEVEDAAGMIWPDEDMIYDHTFSTKPNSGKPIERAESIGSRPAAPRKDPLCPAARAWLDEFMVDFVGSLRVWNASDDCFNTTAFELRPHFVAKYRLLLDAELIRTSNFWRSSRGEPSLRTR